MPSFTLSVWGNPAGKVFLFCRLLTGRQEPFYRFKALKGYFFNEKIF
jgi:hypothetical protein